MDQLGLTAAFDCVDSSDSDADVGIALARLEKAGVPHSLYEHCCTSRWCDEVFSCGKIHWKSDNAVLRWMALHNLCTAEAVRTVIRLGVTEVTDMAHMFTNMAEASAAGCERVWVCARDRSTGISAKDARDVLLFAASSQSRTASALSLSGPANMPLKKASRPKRSRDGSQTADLEARTAAARFVASALKLSGSEAEFIVRRLIGKGFEASTMSSAAMLLADSFLPWLESRSLQLGQCTSLLVEDFCMEAGAASGPRSRWNNLNWLVRHAGLSLDMPTFRAPPSSTDPDASLTQAVEVEPEMVHRLFLHTERLAAADDWRLVPTIAALVMFFAGIRYRHLIRSRFILLSATSVRARCFKGKVGESGTRRSFVWRCPLKPFSSDFDPIRTWWEMWNACSRKAGHPLDYLVFDHRSGKMVDMSCFHNTIREVAVEAMAVTSARAHLLTSYSFRRAAATCLGAWDAPWALRLAFGGWREKIGSNGGGSTNMMPARYDGKKEETEEFSKLVQSMIVDGAFKASSSSTGITWSMLHEWIRSNEGQLTLSGAFGRVATRMAASENDTTTAAFGAEEVVAAMQARTFQFPPRPSSAASLQEPSCSPVAQTIEVPVPADLPLEKPLSDSDSHESDYGADDAPSHPSTVIDEKLHWVTSSRAGEKIHFLNGDLSSTVCRPTSNFLPRLPHDRGSRLDEVLPLSKAICKGCFRSLPVAAQKAFSESGRAPFV